VRFHVRGILYIHSCLNSVLTFFSSDLRTSALQLGTFEDESAASLFSSSSTGKERDTESGNDYFGARYYASSRGRFMSPDPSGLSYADPTNPQSLNLYSYVLNNPLHNIDPSGEECVWDDGSYDAADDPDTGSADKCSGQGGTWIPPDIFEGVEGNQAGSWSGQASSSIASDWLNPSVTVNGNTPWIFTDFQAMYQAWNTGILPQQLNYGPWTAETTTCLITSPSIERERRI
jgi:RHS repeat-associated protein